MKSSDKFYDFLSEFLYLAAKVGIAEDDWKEELYHKITTELQKLMLPEAINDGTFTKFSSYCSQTASYLEVINHCNQKACNFTTNNGKTIPAILTTKNPNPVIGTKPIKKESSDNQSPYLNASTREKLMKEG